MNLRLPGITAALFACLASAPCAEPAAPLPSAAPLPYVLKNRSAFQAPVEDSRVPFWPIGWVRRHVEMPAGSAAVVDAAPRVVIDEKSFKVTSILVGSGTTPSLAVINGRAYSEGEFLRMPKGKAVPVRIRVQRISDGTVVLQHADQILVAALSRPELSARKAEELLNDEDR